LNVRRTSYQSVELHGTIAPSSKIFLYPERSQIAKWADRFSIKLRPFTWILYDHPSRQKAFRILVAILGIAPAWILGGILLARNQDIAIAFLLFSLGFILILLLRLEYLFAYYGYLSVGGGGPDYLEGSFIGYAKLPKKVYVGNSQNMSISLSPAVQVTDDHGDAIEVGKTEGERTELSVRVPMTAKGIYLEHLELELLAAGFEVHGEPNQKQKLTSHKLVYLWNCYYPNSGDQAYAIKFRKIDETAAFSIGHIEGTTRVAKLFNLTQSQVYAIAAVFGIPSGIYLFISALQSLLKVLSGLHLF
jgi:hypothetical protein